MKVKALIIAALLTIAATASAEYPYLPASSYHASEYPYDSYPTEVHFMGCTAFGGTYAKMGAGGWTYWLTLEVYPWDLLEGAETVHGQQPSLEFARGVHAKSSCNPEIFFPSDAGGFIHLQYDYAMPNLRIRLINPPGDVEYGAAYNGTLYSVPGSAFFQEYGSVANECVWYEERVEPARYCTVWQAVVPGVGAELYLHGDDMNVLKVSTTYDPVTYYPAAVEPPAPDPEPAPRPRREKKKRGQTCVWNDEDGKYDCED